MRRYPMRKGGRRWHIAPERWREILAARDAERMAALLGACRCGGQRVVTPDALDAGCASFVSVSRQVDASVSALAEQLGKHCVGGAGGLALSGSGWIFSDGTTVVRDCVDGDAQPAPSNSSGNSSRARNSTVLVCMVRSFGLCLGDAALVQAPALAGLRGCVGSLLALGGHGGLQRGQRRIRSPQAPRLRAQQGQGSGQGQREH